MPEFNLKCISSIRNMAIKSEFLDANLTMLFSSPSRMSGVLSSVLMDNYLHIYNIIKEAKLSLGNHSVSVKW